MSELTQVARTMVAPQKGILAADESSGTIEKRFKSIRLESTEENRRAYRDLLFSAPDLGRHISGVILFDETIRQKSSHGTPFPEVLSRQGILPGIKVDAGTSDLARCPGEKITEGLDRLGRRCQEYVSLGARFAKWRAVITIGPGIPSPTCIAANAHALARYAAICQVNGLVPIVEPEVLMDGDHTIERCEEITEWTLKAVYEALYANRVTLEDSVLKPSMVISGKDCPRQAGAAEVAERTVTVLKRCVPAAVAGIAFLSGGQAEKQATENLNQMNRLFEGKIPWPLTFSYGRALQAPPLQAWGGDAANVAHAQSLLSHRARMNGLAAAGHYRPELEND
jgi:fructose-bisphosphate aldolase class I